MARRLVRISTRRSRQVSKRPARRSLPTVSRPFQAAKQSMRTRVGDYFAVALAVLEAAETFPAASDAVT
jgi:hypothetical protein